MSVYTLHMGVYTLHMGVYTLRSSVYTLSSDVALSVLAYAQLSPCSVDHSVVS